MPRCSRPWTPSDASASMIHPLTAARVFPVAEGESTSVTTASTTCPGLRTTVPPPPRRRRSQGTPSAARRGELQVLRGFPARTEHRAEVSAGS